MTEATPTSNEIVHYYAGWPGKALCLGKSETPLMTVSSIKADNVTCEQCKRMLTARHPEQPSSKPGFVCSDCGNTFLQKPRCTSCGAEKLYDAAVRNLQEDNARYESGRVILLGEIDSLKQKLLAAEQLAVRQGNTIRRLSGEREPPHCASCSCGLVESGGGVHETTVRCIDCGGELARIDGLLLCATCSQDSSP